MGNLFDASFAFCAGFAVGWQSHAFDERGRRENSLFVVSAPLFKRAMFRPTPIHQARKPCTTR
jgi:hypothetical protein